MQAYHQNRRKGHKHFTSCLNRLPTGMLQGQNVFIQTKDDNKQGTSVEDRQFLNLMNHSMLKNSDGYWEAPLPVKVPRSPLPNNKVQAQNRYRAYATSPVYPGFER